MLLYYRIIVLLYYRIIVLSYYRIIILLYYYIIIFILLFLLLFIISNILPLVQNFSPIGYLFLTANYPLTIGLTIIYMVIIISRQLLEPKIISANIGINPLITLLAVFISIQLWGLSGVLIAPLILIIVTTCNQTGVFKQLWYYVKGS